MFRGASWQVGGGCDLKVENITKELQGKWRATIIINGDGEVIKSIFKGSVWLDMVVELRVQYCRENFQDSLKRENSIIKIFLA